MIPSVSGNAPTFVYTNETDLKDNVKTNAKIINSSGENKEIELAKIVSERAINIKPEITDTEIESLIKKNLQNNLPSLLSDNDEKWMKLAINLCRVLSDDSLQQQERRNQLEGLVIGFAQQLKDLKYKEASIQVKAAIVSAVVSISIAIAGAAISIKGINPANPSAITASSIVGQTTTTLSQTLGQVISQAILADATRLQGDAEVIRGEKEALLSGISSHNKVSDDQNTIKKKLLDMVSHYFDNRQAATGQIINNMKT